jgi:hypothetical protein
MSEPETGGLFPELPQRDTEPEPVWTVTREQLINALANIEVRGVYLTGPMAGKVVADDVADAILSQLPQPASTFTHYGVTCGCDDGRPHAVKYDDEEDARAHLHLEWYEPDAYVVRRTVTSTQWERADPEVTP